MLCPRSTASVFEHCGNVDRVWRLRHPFRILELARAGLRMRRLRFELVVGRDGGVRTRELLFFRLLNAAEYIGQESGKNFRREAFPRDEFPTVKPPDFLNEYVLSGLKIFSRTIPTGGRGVREVKGDVLRLAGIENFSDEYDSPRDPAAEKEIAAFLEKGEIAEGKYIALNLFGNGGNRKISAENALVIVEKLYGKYAPLGWKCVLLGSPKDDAAVARVLALRRERAGTDPLAAGFLTALRPTVSFFQNVELIARAGLLISPDTALVHVGDAFGIPMIGFFSPPKLLAALGLPTWLPHERPTTRAVFYMSDVNEIDFRNLTL